MNQPPCIFCKIIAGQIPATIIASNDAIVVIQDINPKAPIHYLIIPRQHVPDIVALLPDQGHIPAAMVAMAKDLALKLPEGAQSFRLIANNGVEAGQSVFHLHFHFLAGRVMSDF